MSNTLFFPKFRAKYWIMPRKMHHKLQLRATKAAMAKRLKQLGLEGKFTLSQALELLAEHEPEQLKLKLKGE